MDFFWTYLWPVIVIVAQSVLLLVILLVAIAYILLADRKIWAAVQIRRGPNVVGPWGLFQSFADLLKFVVKEPVIPAGANKGVFLLAPLVTCVLALAAWAVIPVNKNWVIANINVGVLYIFADGLRRDHGGVGLEFEISVSCGAALGGADGLLRGLDRLRHHHRAALRRITESYRYRCSAGRKIRPIQLVLVAAVSDVRGVFHLGSGRDEQTAVRSCGGGIGTRRRIHGRVRLDALHDVHARRVRGDRDHVRHGDHPVPGRLAFTCAVSALHLGARRDLVHAQGAVHVFPVRHGQAPGSTLSLRPTH